MMASARIRKEIWKKGLNELFCNRDFLVHATRAVVDQVLSIMAKEGYIVRLARGVYCRQLGQTKFPSVAEIIQFKAVTFNRTIKQTIDGAAARLGLKGKEQPNRHAFITNSSTSSFAIFGEQEIIRVYFKRASARKMSLSDDPVDTAIKTFWNVEKPLKKATVHEVVRKLRLTKDDEQELRSKAKLMPAWVADVVTEAIRRLRL